MSATRNGRRPLPSRATGGRRLGVVLLACAGLLLTTAACGARWDDAQRDAVLAANSGERLSAGSGGSDGTTDGASTSGGTGAAGRTTTTAAGAYGGGDGGATGGSGGTQAATGGGEAAGPSGPQPCAAPSDAPGVTDTTITLGSISTLSGAVPGLGASSEGAARAYVAYRNATGGVCGRELVLKTADDAMDNGRHRAIVNEMNGQVLGVVGGLGGGDAGSAQLVDQLGIPVVNVSISVDFANAAMTFGINPYFADVDQPLPKFEYLYAQGVRKAAIVYPAVDQTRSEINLRQKPQMIASGIEVVHQQEVPLTTLSYDSAARAVANSGADYLMFLADGSISASMARSMANTGYEGLKVEEYLTSYGTNFPELAGPGAEGAVSWIRTLPNEEAGSNAEQSAFLEWMGRIAPDQPADTFAADSWASAKAFIDNLEALPGPISREAVVTQLSSVGEYDAGGLLGPIQLGAQVSNGCVIAMRYESGGWRRLTPEQGFLC